MGMDYWFQKTLLPNPLKNRDEIFRDHVGWRYSKGNSRIEGKMLDAKELKLALPTHDCVK